MPYRVLQSSFNDRAPDGERCYWKSHYLDELTDAAIDVIASRAGALPGSFSNMFLEPLGGAVARIEAGATAFPHRRAQYSFGISPGWTDPQHDDAAIAWTREVHAATAPHATGGVYANYLDYDDAGRMTSAYGENYERLQRIKARYDPHDLFRRSHGRSPGR